MDIKEINIEDDAYPVNLRRIHNAPRKIYVKGEMLSSDDNAVAIVGTRRPSFYGLEQCEKLSYELAERGVTIVSGMALGIDTAAHRGALKAKGRTLAVLGSGHGDIYPPENKKLYDEIAKNGAVISEFPHAMPPLSGNFPKRNRIISGLALGVVIVEAPDKSGALITANFALEQNREVFALPGNITNQKARGANKLIKEGAKLVESVQDILDELKNVLTIKESDGQSKEAGQCPTPSMTSEEKMIFGILEDNEPKSFDDIRELTNLAANKISELLLKLELRKMVKLLPGQVYVRRGG